MLKRPYIPSGLGAPQNPPRIAGRCCWRENIWATTGLGYAQTEQVCMMCSWKSNTGRQSKKPCMAFIALHSALHMKSSNPSSFLIPAQLANHGVKWAKKCLDTENTDDNKHQQSINRDIKGLQNRKKGDHHRSWMAMSMPGTFVACYTVCFKALMMMMMMMLFLLTEWMYATTVWLPQSIPVY